MLGNEIDRIVYVLDLEGLLLVHFDAEFFLKSCNQLYTLHGIRSQVEYEICIIGDFGRVHFKHITDNILDARQDLISVHFRKI